MTAATGVTAKVAVHSAFADLPRVNLLPPEIQQGRKFRRVQGGLAAVVVAAVAAVAVAYLFAASSASKADQQLRAATAAQTQMQARVAAYKGVTDTYARAAAVEAMLTTAMGKEVRYSQLMNTLSTSMPANVWVTTAAFSEGAAAAGAATPAATAAATAATASGIGTLTLSGHAFSYADVATWLESIAVMHGLSTPPVQSVTEELIGTHRAVAWSTSVVVGPAALSGRYTTAGG